MWRWPHPGWDAKCQHDNAVRLSFRAADRGSFDPIRSAVAGSCPPVRWPYWSLLTWMVRAVGIEPTLLAERDFESGARMANLLIDCGLYAGQCTGVLIHVLILMGRSHRKLRRTSHYKKFDPLEIGTIMGGPALPLALETSFIMSGNSYSEHGQIVAVEFGKRLSTLVSLMHLPCLGLAGRTNSKCERQWKLNFPNVNLNRSQQSRRDNRRDCLSNAFSREAYPV